MAKLDLFIGDRPLESEVFRIDPIVRGAHTNIRFEVGARIASGGNGVVHSCIDSRTGDDFAIKFQLKIRANRARRFRREIELMRSLKHAHLIQYLDDGTVAAQGFSRRIHQLTFVVMERARTNLASFIAENRAAFHYSIYIGQFRGLAGALKLLHSKAIHRDIKPENVLVVGDRWVLSDFGLCAPSPYREAAITQQFEPVGPRYWMSPEAINRVLGCADKCSKSSDVFQLASVFWYAVTGRHPLGIVERADWNGPDPLCDVLIRCLAHRSSARPVDGDAFHAALEDAVMKSLPPAS